MNLSAKDFEDKISSGKNFVVWEEFKADLTTPVSCLMNISNFSKYHCLFESVTGGEKKGRYSIIAFNPDKIWKCENKKSFISLDKGETYIENKEANVFKSLNDFVKESKIEDLPKDIPNMSAGVFGFMGYDMVKLMEELPDENPANIDIPDGIYFRPKYVIIFDNITDRSYVIRAFYSKEDISFDTIKEEFEDIKTKVFCPTIVGNKPSMENKEIEFKSHISKGEFENMVKRSIEYIKAGDIFQIVPSRRFSSDFHLKPVSFYRSLRSLNPSPYLFYLSIDDFQIIGSSPEILVKVQDGEVTVRPLAGTRKRSDNEKEDKALEADLLSDKKELAEHLMLLDLGRNDVSRVAKAGTVKVTDKMTVERYSHVMHIVSNVSGVLDKKYDYMDALIAGFPAGTVSGAPKIRAMEIIDELEPEKRQFYAGTVGYFSATGNLDTCIALRTALIKDNKIYVQAGAGVVYDSIPENEYFETENKAMALIKAAIEAINYE